MHHSSSGCMVVWWGMHMISVCKAIRKIVHPLTSQSPVFTYLLFLKCICISNRVTTWLLKNRSLFLDVNFAAKSFQLQLTSVDNLSDLEITSYFRTTVPFKCWWQLQIYCVPRGGINNNIGESCLCVAVCAVQLLWPQECRLVMQNKAASQTHFRILAAWRHYAPRMINKLILKQALKKLKMPKIQGHKSVKLLWIFIKYAYVPTDLLCHQCISHFLLSLRVEIMPEKKEEEIARQVRPA